MKLSSNCNKMPLMLLGCNVCSLVVLAFCYDSFLYTLNQTTLSVVYYTIFLKEKSALEIASCFIIITLLLPSNKSAHGLQRSLKWCGSSALFWWKWQALRWRGGSEGKKTIHKLSHTHMHCIEPKKFYNLHFLLSPNSLWCTFCWNFQLRKMIGVLIMKDWII